MDRTSTTTVSVPSLDEWIGNHGIEEDIFYYLLKLKEENDMYEITLWSNTGNRGGDLMDIPSTSAEAGTEPQNNQTSSSYTPSECEDRGGPIEGHQMDPCPSSEDEGGPIEGH